MGAPGVEFKPRGEGLETNGGGRRFLLIPRETNIRLVCGPGPATDATDVLFEFPLEMVVVRLVYGAC